MLWLALHLPDLPLELWTRHADTPAAESMPLAIVEQQWICRSNTAARAQGVYPGLGRAVSLALCPDLQLRERQPPREQRLLNGLAQGALQFTPQVCIDEPEADAPTLLLEIGGCLRLFHGLAALLARVDAYIAEQGVTVRRALAATPSAAALYARNRTDTTALFTDDGRGDTARLQQALAGLPLAGLALDTHTEESLMNMGFRQLGDIEALPRHTLARRFGKPFALWLDRVTGAVPDPRVALRPETFYVRELNFLDGIVHTEGLAFPMQRLLGDFTQFLRQRQLATQHLVWRCTQVDHTVQEIVVRTSQAEMSPARFMALTRIHMESLRLTAPVETLRLACRQFVPLAGAGFATSLFAEDNRVAEREEGGRNLVDRLRARLGDTQCRQLAVENSWRPEQAQHGNEAGPAVAAEALPSLAARRPLWLLPQPAGIVCQGRQLYWHGALELLEGPERLDSDWWAQPLQRDYFIARHSDQQAGSAGVHYWVFHDRREDQWFVHGVFG